MLLREQRDLLRGGVPLTGEKIDSLLPGGLLPAVEFPHVENMPLENPAPGDSPVFDNAPVKVLLAVLEAFFAAKKNDMP
jgi:hypothetical protein